MYNNFENLIVILTNMIVILTNLIVILTTSMVEDGTTLEIECDN